METFVRYCTIVSNKLNSKSYKNISIHWIYEELERLEKKNRYMKIPYELKCSSINNESVFPICGFPKHPNSSTNM